MSLTKLAVCAMMIAFFVSPTASMADEHNKHQYFEGAMTIYSKFKEPSREQSEQFYSFIKSKWQQARCQASCSVDGRDAANEYAMQRKVKLDDENK
ncbi:hypothetical protein fHeYen901_121 [Yersinia phage fHe-Yen9-01]|uniref:RI lysis inhibition regulator membrane protein n=1 Tax=Yersinia phage fHe-Yen9-01 TaxID=1965363 RepID=A0A1V0DXM7_9CAUD|nr:lysis inhibition [Yersinia phage fHe-Yen9-01]ARB05894.1 hypothetical protein fHeYen901_121 [Yersinia phage fHe-Yen9-01]